MSCPICEIRAPKRFCPAKGEKICAICCGKERELTIDCVLDCPYLIAAHRYESEHRKPLPSDSFPHRDIQISPDFVYAHWPVITGLAGVILKLQASDRHLSDPDVVTALDALSETYRTLGTGIYYEHPPDLLPARSVYAEIAKFIQEFRKTEATQARVASNLKDGDVFHLLLFLTRIGRQETNGRPRSRAFLGFLRTQFPLPAEATAEASRIIMP